MAVSDPVRAAQNRRLLEELVPDKIPIDLLLSVLRLLLEERVSIRNLPLILESVAEARSLPTPDSVADHVRQRLGFQIVAELRREDGTVPLLQLAPDWEKTFATHQTEAREVALPPDVFARLAAAMSDRLAKAAGLKPSCYPAPWRRQQMSTSSPAILNCGSKPPTACRA